jgi:hypothetical protein
MVRPSAFLVSEMHPKSIAIVRMNRGAQLFWSAATCRSFELNSKALTSQHTPS